MVLSLDDFAVASRPKRSVCTMAKVFDALNDKDTAVLSAALADVAVTHAAIAAVLEANGHKINQGTIARHRRNQCTCEP